MIRRCTILQDEVKRTIEPHEPGAEAQEGAEWHALGPTNPAGAQQARQHARERAEGGDDQYARQAVPGDPGSRRRKELSIAKPDPLPPADAPIGVAHEKDDTRAECGPCDTMKDRRRLDQAVPFALEEHLPFSVDDAVVAHTTVARKGDTAEVFIRKEGDDVILSPRPPDWSSYLANGPVASAEFMTGVEDLPVQERDL